MILNGSETIKGDSIIIPIATSTLATAKAKKHYRTAEIFIFYASLDHHKSKKTLQNRRDFHFLCIPGPPQKQKNTTEPQRFSFSLHPWTTTKAKKHYRTAEIFIFFASL